MFSASTKQLCLQEKGFGSDVTIVSNVNDKNWNSAHFRLWHVTVLGLPSLFLLLMMTYIAARTLRLPEARIHSAETTLPIELVVSCYYNTPSADSHNQLLPADIPPQLCTHINVAFARVVDKQVFLDDTQIRALPSIVKLKQLNPKLKILLSVGGAGSDNGFSDMVVNHASRKVFIRSIRDTLKKYTLDGIDLDWEFPALSNQVSGPHERQHFSQLLREIRMEYIRENRDYILSVAVAAPEPIINVSYDIDQINKYTDFVNVMTYDYHFYTKFTPFTGLNSPLYARANERMYLATLNTNYTVALYINKGLDRSKIVVGIPMYGHTFTLVNENNTKVGSPASGFGSLGSLGFVNYPDVCNYLEKYKEQVLVELDKEAMVPFLHRGLEWASFETAASVRDKAQYIVTSGLRGAMLYSLNADDYRGACSPGGSPRFPLARTVRRALTPDNKTGGTLP